MPLYTAPLILPVTTPPIENGWVLTDESGLIIELGNGTPAGECVPLNGILIPGFINTHCHLELSFLRNRITEKAGMTGFIEQLMQLRGATGTVEQRLGIEEALSELKHNGIVAVGDISNTSISASFKEESDLHFHTFIEAMGLAEVAAQRHFANAQKLIDEFRRNSNTVSISPHAPYSVSDNLFTLINQQSQQANLPITIHLQESEDEIQFCKDGSGAMAEFFKKAGFDFSAFNFKNHSPIHRVLTLLKDAKQIILVHNTFVNADDIMWAEDFHKGLAWCLCPKANLFITGTLPPVDLLYEYAEIITVGTDSLASNNSLDILDELKVLATAFPNIPFEELIRWSTINGAIALDVEKEFGSIEPGKKPGLLLIEDTDVTTRILNVNSKVTRII